VSGPGDPAGLTVADVKPGDELPPLSVEVSATTVILGALASRDWRPMHHDRDFAIHRNGTRDIFMNTPNLAAWFERYLTDWTGPTGRLGRMTFRMHDSIFPGDTMVFRGSVEQVASDASGTSWADVALRVSVGERTMTTCTARVALPRDRDDNPWQRRGEAWQP
jgi:acyl dehydratase